MAAAGKHGRHKIKGANHPSTSSNVTLHRIGSVRPTNKIVLKKLIRSAVQGSNVFYIRPENISAFAANPQALQQSFYYLPRTNLSDMKTLVKHPHLLAPYVRVFESENVLSGLWVPHRTVSEAAGHSAERIKAAEKKYGSPILWSNVFENFHDSFWSFLELGFYADGVYWRGPEQYFQFGKLAAAFRTHELRQKVANMSETEAYNWGTALSGDEFCGKEHWEKTKVDVMRMALALKFADKEMGALLCSTRGIPLVSVKGGFWGFPGANKLGELLMKCRGD